MRAVLLGMTALLGAIVVSGVSWGDDSASFAIRNVDVFDGSTLKRAQDVIVRDGLISAVGAHLAIPTGLAVTEGTGKTLLPGLIDAHVHSWGASRSDALRFGVTTELDMFMDWHALAAARTARQSLARTAGSDLWSAGTLATVPGGHGTEYGMEIPTLTAASQAQSWVDDRVREGSDYIKIILEPGFAQQPIPTLSPDEVAALIAAAHHDGKMVLAHVHTLSDARLAATDGVDALAHVFYDQQADDSFVKLARRRHLFVIATLSVWSTAGCGPMAQTLAHDAALQPYLTSEQTGMLGVTFGSCSRALETALKNVRILHQAGVPLLAGTDSGNPGTAHGASLLGEIELLVQAGLTPVEALAAATSVPAAHFSLSDRGRIAPGKRADLVLIAGDPTREPAAIRHIAAVWKNGYQVERKPQQTAAAAVAGGFTVPAQFHPVHGPLAAQSPVPDYAGHIVLRGTSGDLDVTVGDEVFKGAWRAVAGGDAPAAAQATDAAATLPQDWDLIYGAGYYKAHVQGNRLFSRALLSGNTGATLTAEIIGENNSFTGAARDSRGNVYKVTFGQ